MPLPAEIAILLAKQEFPCTQEVKVTGYAEVPLSDDFEGDKAEAFMLVQNDVCNLDFGDAYDTDSEPLLVEVE